MAIKESPVIGSAARSTAPTKGRDKHYLRTTLAISAAVYLGFSFTYFGPHLRGTYPETAAAVHVHGWSFFGWYLLLPLQASLIHSRRVRLHRSLGWLSIALASLMVASGLLVIGVRMEEALASAEPSFWSMFGPMIFTTLALFTGFYAAALIRRRVGAYHKRLLIVASSAGMGAAAFRIIGALWGQVIWAVPVGILASNLFIVAGMVHDYTKEKQVHQAYRMGLLICIGVEVGLWLLTPTLGGTRWRMASPGWAVLPDFCTEARLRLKAEGFTGAEPSSLSFLKPGVRRCWLYMVPPNNGMHPTANQCPSY